MRVLIAAGDVFAAVRIRAMLAKENLICDTTELGRDSVAGHDCIKTRVIATDQLGNVACEINQAIDDVGIDPTHDDAGQRLADKDFGRTQRCDQKLLERAKFALTGQ